MTTATAQRELPILMHARSIAGIESGRKTQTRRIIKPPVVGREPQLQPSGSFLWWHVENDLNAWEERRCPYGELGDRLWVREAWTAHCTPSASRSLSTDGRATGLWWHEIPKSLRGPKPIEMVWYRAGDVRHHMLDGRGRVHAGEEGRSSWEPGEDDRDGLKWQPSIFLPKWACRYWLHVILVRVQRVQDISEYDAAAEGVDHPPEPFPIMGWAGGSRMEEAQDRWRIKYGRWHRDRFAELWDATNGAGAWKRNDWVWAVTFGTTEAPR